MRAFISFLACLVPLVVFAAEEERHPTDALPHHCPAPPPFAGGTVLLTLILEEATKTVATVTVREKHGGKCGGALETAPRRFTIEIDLKSGAARWDNNNEMEMNPIRQ
jgi:hypothetical protein